VPTREQQLADDVRRAARRFATGVTIMAIRDADGDGFVHALTANSFVTLSLDPALIGIAVGTQGRMRQTVERVRVFGVSVLNECQREYASHYASSGRIDEPAHLPLPFADTVPPVPVVPGCAAFFACELRDIVPVGDHDLLVGEVLTCDALNHDETPLIFLDGRYREHREHSEHRTASKRDGHSDESVNGSAVQRHLGHAGAPSPAGART
jgi:flavin reductase (DIM6/NTAB) family NADH-FMN oxidoreductase RutF